MTLIKNYLLTLGYLQPKSAQGLDNVHMAMLPPKV
jgi:hypothetical protein